MNIDLDKTLAAGRYAVTYVGGIVTALGLSSTVDPSTLQAGFDHVFNGIKEVAVGAGILAPLGMTAWGIFEQTVGQLIAKLHNKAPMEVLNAVSRNAPGALAIATAALPGVQVTVSNVASPSLRTLASDDSQPDIVKASSSAPTIPPPVARVQKE